MSDQSSQAAAFALQEILLGIADGLNEAQQALREQPPYDAYGRPNTMYQLPYLDFSLKVTSEFDETTQTVGGGSEPTAANWAKLRFRPVKQITTEEETTTSGFEIVSTISGRFVASVPNEGLPQIILLVKATVVDPLASPVVADLEVVVSNAAGEILPNTTVEFNYDAEASEAFNDGTTAVPTFGAAEVKSDATGKATTTVSMDSTEFAAGNFFVIKVNVGTVSKSISISND